MVLHAKVCGRLGDRRHNIEKPALRSGLFAFGRTPDGASRSQVLAPSEPVLPSLAMPARKTSAPAKLLSAATARAQLDAFLDKYTPEIAAAARLALRRMRARLPGACELVYDNYNALAVGFAPGDRTSDAIFSIAVFPRWVSLFFLQSGNRLRDPDGYLEGSGNQARHIKLDSGARIDDPGVQDLIAQALELARVPIDPAQPRRLIIKSISAKQRPRRPAGA
jgi:hypothetical protein